jgi:YD repeat-containing protein
MFGFHRYDTPIPIKDDDYLYGVKLCSVCKLKGKRTDTNNITVYYEFDSNMNPIHYKDSNGIEQWSDYDEKGNLVHYKNEAEYECWLTYDEQGKEIDREDNWPGDSTNLDDAASYV